MEGISDLCIIGLDDRRPPQIRKEPYIDLFFRLNHKAPADWSSLFNELTSKHEYKPSIKPEEGEFIDAWVRTPREIPTLLNTLKETITKCTEMYIERVEERRRAARGNQASTDSVSPEQAELNRVVEGLKFDQPDLVSS